jgi:hypothetical protein
MWSNAWCSSPRAVLARGRDAHLGDPSAVGGYVDGEVDDLAAQGRGDELRRHPDRAPAGDGFHQGHRGAESRPAVQPVAGVGEDLGDVEAT